MPDIAIEGPDGAFAAYLALPRKTPAPAILVAQEIFGVNRVMREVCDWLAEEGFLACCPDIFWRIEPGIQITDQTDAEWKRAFELFELFDVGKGIGDLKVTLASLKSHEACSGKAGTIGFCLGGKLAYLMAARSDTNASVGYYGVGLAELLDEAPAIQNPLMLHVAAKDQFVPPEQQKKVATALNGNALVTLHDYASQDHAFARLGGKHYDRAAAVLANQRTIDFFKEHLAT